MEILVNHPYGEIADYKEQTPQFNRVLTSIVGSLMSLSLSADVRAETSLALVRKYLPLKNDFRPDDRKVRVLILDDKVAHFMQSSHLGKRLYLLQIVECLVRLGTRSGFEALALFEEAVVKARFDLGLAGQVTPNQNLVTERVSTNTVTPTSKTRKKPPVKKPVNEETNKPKKRFSVKPSEKPLGDEVTPHTPTDPVQEKPAKTKRQSSTTVENTEKDNTLSRIDQAINRGKETLAEAGQIIQKNPLVDQFMS